MALLEFNMYPLGKGESVGGYVARCLKIVEESGLDYKCHAMGTVLEGDLDEAFRVVRNCLSDMTTDCDRVECMIKIDYRKGYQGELKGRIPRIEKRLDHSVKQ